VILGGWALAAGPILVEDEVNINDEKSSFTSFEFLDEEAANDEKGSPDFEGIIITADIVACLFGAGVAFFLASSLE
jgi:hypothetical protein